MNFLDVFEMRSFEVRDEFPHSNHGEIVTNVDHLPGNTIDGYNKLSSMQEP